MSINDQKTLATSRQMSRYAGWIPANHIVYRDFMKTRYEDGLIKAHAAHEPAVAQFEKAINADKGLRSLFDLIFIQAAQLGEIAGVKIPKDLSDNKRPKRSDKSHFGSRPRTFDSFLGALDGIVVAPPRFHVTTDEHGNPIGVPIGVPMYLLFDILSNTSAAYDLFRKPAFNTALKDLLDFWGEFLTTDASGSSLNEEEGGWFSPVAMESLEHNRGKFALTYVLPDPDAPNRGFRSWDAFFVREIRPEARPIDFAGNKSLLHNACESTVYNISCRVKKHDRFWLKAQSYSLYDMLNRDDEYADKFVGGTMGRLSRRFWYLGPTTVLPDAGADPDDPDLAEGDPRGALIRSQGFLTMSSARALIYIQADNADIGLMCFIGVGMAEVSTCALTVNDGDRVSTGDELGMFHFGGSSHSLIFGPQAKVTFADVVQPDTHLLVNSVLGQVEKA
ncbi:phosphatidylserine decarboxylase [Coprinopsis sp. MPI-PUGE-AT-0042]|nr:phosphatidylserine decarboxylase [Coprinopsis sp. MPI-PUGE-AT-0042]